MISHCNEDKDLPNKHSSVLQGLLGKLKMAPSDRPITVYVQQSGLNVIPYLSDLSFTAGTYSIQQRKLWQKIGLCAHPPPLNAVVAIIT